MTKVYNYTMKPGRPTKYNEAILLKTQKYFQECLRPTDGKMRMPFIEELSLLLDIDDDTVNEWTKDPEKKQFSAIIKRIRILQRLRLTQRCLGKNPTGAIFLLKVDHGKKETTVLEGSSAQPPVFYLPNNDRDNPTSK